MKFPGGYEYHVEQVSDKCVNVRVDAKGFTKSLFISMPDNYKYTYSDNYLDLEAGQSAVVTITADCPIDPAQISLCDYNEMLAKGAGK